MIEGKTYLYEGGAWAPAGGWYVSTGRKYGDAYGNLPRAEGGFHKLTNRWLPNTPSTSSSATRRPM